MAYIRIMGKQAKDESLHGELCIEYGHRPWGKLQVGMGA